MKNKKKVTSEDIPNTQPAILGTFEGECADSNITNLNGLDITRPVWETVFASDEYKKGIELGHYIGFLGHPEDPNCMDFEHACIVMTEGHIDDDGKIYGKFNLIDTPVGRIVKTYQDAGVQFGISVRGAGDIIDNSVEPESFVFRGFDLVAFPAYPDSIPKFTQIAASVDAEEQKKYKAVCASVRNNLQSINTCEAIEILQPYFSDESDEYQLLEDRKAELMLDDDEVLDISEEKIEGLTDLLIDARNEISELTESNECLKTEVANISLTASRKAKVMRRILGNQVSELKTEVDTLDRNISKVKASRNKYKNNFIDKSAKVDNLTKANLKYKQRIRSAEQLNDEKDRIIASLQSQLDETVAKASENEHKVSNLDNKIRKLQSQITAQTDLIENYQEAYGNMYANALGVYVDNISVTASTSVKELQTIINEASSKSRLYSSESEPDESMDFDAYDEDDGIVTL